MLLTLDVVGGGTALEVHGAVLHQRDTGLRSHQVVFDLEVWHVEVFFQGFDDFQLDVVGVADRFAGSIRDIGKRNGSVAMAQGDGAGLFDLLQGAGEFGGENWRADQSGSNGCAQDMGNDAHQIFLDIVFFMEPVLRPFCASNT
ncbi:hypothetical protein D9M72_571400 [compost metagenome]